MTTWAITGGSGFVGSALAARLAGQEVRLLSRSAAGSNVIAGDIEDARALAKLVTGADVVVHLAAYVHRAARTPAEIAECERINVGGTRALIDAMKAHAPEAFLIFASSASVYGASNAALTETSVCHPTTVYGRTKLEAEQLVLASQLRACVLRPAMIFGPGAPGNLERLARFARKGILIRVSASPARKSLLPIDTAIDAILAVAQAPEKADRNIFNVTGGPPLTMHEIASHIADAYGKKLRTIVVPRLPVIATARLGDAILRRLPLPAPALGQLVATYTSDAVLDDAKFRETFAFAPRATIAESLARSFHGA